MREYHVWEKELREYLAEEQSPNSPPMKFDGNFVEAAKLNLKFCDKVFPQALLGKFHKFRNKVNTTKHDVGVLADHFVSEDEVREVNDVVSDFWSEIAQQEGIPMRFPLPKM